MTSVIAPGAWLGLLGGGQLGRMFCMAAQSLGYRVAVLDPGDDEPGGQRRRPAHRADYLDAAALAELAALAPRGDDRVRERARGGARLPRANARA